MAVTATPWSEESSTRRSALPRVVPKPRSSGSTTTRAYLSLETVSSEKTRSGIWSTFHFIL